MKKLIFTLLLFGLTLNAFSQIEKGSNILTLNGMFSSMHTFNGVLSNSIYDNQKTLSLGASYSVMQEKFLFGIGVDFYGGRDVKKITTLILNKYYQIENSTTVSAIVLPNIYTGYYQRIFDKLYFTTNLKFGIGAAYESISSTTALFDNEAMNMTSDILGHNEDALITTLEITPEFTYYISNKTGISLYTGGLGYSMTNWNFSNSNLIINFNPNTWLVGLKIIM